MLYRIIIEHAFSFPFYLRKSSKEIGNNFTHLKVTASWQNHNGEAALQQQLEWRQRYMLLPMLNFDALLSLLPVQVPKRLQPAKNRLQVRTQKRRS